MLPSSVWTRSLRQLRSLYYGNANTHNPPPSGGSGTLPGLFGLGRAQLAAAMAALSGEGVSGTQETAFGAAGMFTSIFVVRTFFLLWHYRSRGAQTVSI